MGLGERKVSQAQGHRSEGGCNRDRALITGTGGATELKEGGGASFTPLKGGGGKQHSQTGSSRA